MSPIQIPSTFTEKAKALSQQVHEWHYPQIRKFTKEPYANHLIRVAQTIQTHTQDEVLVAAALCHDVLEDTEVTKKELRAGLVAVGYEVADAKRIVLLVIELTDVYTKKRYPKKNRAARKELELRRLQKISPLAVTVKLADLFDNIRDLKEYNPSFAKVYFRETLPLLELETPYTDLQEVVIRTYGEFL